MSAAAKLVGQYHFREEKKIMTQDTQKETETPETFKIIFILCGSLENSRHTKWVKYQIDHIKSMRGLLNMKIEAECLESVEYITDPNQVNAVVFPSDNAIYAAKRLQKNHPNIFVTVFAETFPRDQTLIFGKRWANKEIILKIQAISGITPMFKDNLPGATPAVLCDEWFTDNHPSKKLLIKMFTRGAVNVLSPQPSGLVHKLSGHKSH